MDISIEFSPGNAAAKLTLSPGETCTAEAGAMIAMSGDMQITTSMHQRSGGGLIQAMKRTVAGESFFLNHFTPGAAGGEVYLAATLPGDMMTHELDQETLIVQAGSFVACEDGIDLDVGWQGFKTIFSGESLLWLRLSGSGQVVFNSFGAIYPEEVDGTKIVDTGHIVAFSESLKFSVAKAGTGWISSFLSGEGLVCRFAGRGTVWCQSHNADAFGHTVGPMLKHR